MAAAYEGRWGPCKIVAGMIHVRSVVASGSRLFPILSAVVIWSGFAIACSGAENSSRTAPVLREEAPVRSEPSDTARPQIVVLGDSLTAGLGLDTDESYPALLQQRLQMKGYDFKVVNAGVSGDTSAGGLRRLDWALEGDVRVLIVALGANDGLRGLGVSEMKKNLRTIIERARARGIAVVLAGMEAPPNFGTEYTAQFRQVFYNLASEEQVAFVPFLLDGVAGHPELNQRDGIHPNPDGARTVSELVWPVLEGLLESPGSQAGFTR